MIRIEKVHPVYLWTALLIVRALCGIAYASTHVVEVRLITKFLFMCVHVCLRASGRTPPWGTVIALHCIHHKVFFKIFKEAILICMYMWEFIGNACVFVFVCVGVRCRTHPGDNKAAPRFTWKAGGSQGSMFVCACTVSLYLSPLSTPYPNNPSK